MVDRFSEQTNVPPPPPPALYDSIAAVDEFPSEASIPRVPQIMTNFVPPLNVKVPWVHAPVPPARGAPWWFPVVDAPEAPPLAPYALIVYEPVAGTVQSWYPSVLLARL